MLSHHQYYNQTCKKLEKEVKKDFSQVHMSSDIQEAHYIISNSPASQISIFLLLQHNPHSHSQQEKSRNCIGIGVVFQSFDRQQSFEKLKLNIYLNTMKGKMCTKEQKLFILREKPTLSGMSNFDWIPCLIGRPTTISYIQQAILY